MEERKILMDFTNKSGGKAGPDQDGKLDLTRAEEDANKTFDNGLENWYEVRFPELGPHRRGYHSSFINKNR